MKKTPLLLSAILAWAAVLSCRAMNSNLALPYSDKPSPPAVAELAFYCNDSETLLFDKGAAIEIYCRAGVRSVGLAWELHHNRIVLPIREGKAEALPANVYKITIDTAGLRPGFYDITATLDNGTPKPTLGVCTFGWKARQMAIHEDRPADFRAFWDKAMAEYEKIPLDPKIESPVTTYNDQQIDDYNVKCAALPPDYDPQGHRAQEVESYKISFAGPDGGRVYGWLAKPKGNGPFPAMLVLPGAGFAARPRPLEHARHGYLALDIQIHGQDVDLPTYPHIPGYYTDWIYEPADQYYFYNVYRRAARAVDYLASLPEVMKDKIVTVGGSQGGRLAIVVPALDKRVAASVSCIANSPNHPHLVWVEQCNGVRDAAGMLLDLKKTKPIPRSNGDALAGAPSPPDNAEDRCMPYYDPMNFAPDVHCPILMNSGLIDPVSPPYSVWAVYFRLGSSDHEIVPLPGMAHDWSPEFDRRAWHWLDAKLGLKARKGS